MRVLFVNPYYKPYLGGIERIIERIAPELHRKVEVEAVGLVTTRVFFPDRQMHDLPSHEVIDGLQVFRCRFYPSRIPRVFHAARAGYISPGLPAVVRRFKPDVVHLMYGEWWGANLYTYALTRRSVHVVSTFFHDIPRLTTTMPLYVVNEWLIPRMDAIHVMSQVEKTQVVRAYRAPSQRVHVIPPGVDLPERIECKTPGTGVTVFAVGRFNEHKGQVRLAHMLEAAAIVIQMPVRLVLVGDDAGDGDALRRLSARDNCRIRIEVVGHCSDRELSRLYSESDIFALPSRYESFGLVYLEAMAHGVPVVAYDVGPVGAVLKRGAIVVPQGDEAAFTQALIDLAGDAEFRQRLGSEGEQFVRANFSWAVMAEKLLALYGDAMRKRSLSPVVP